MRCHTVSAHGKIFLPKRGPDASICWAPSQLFSFVRSRARCGHAEHDGGAARRTASRSHQEESGAHALVVATAYWRVGLTICHQDGPFLGSTGPRDAHDRPLSPKGRKSRRAATGVGGARRIVGRTEGGSSQPRPLWVCGTASWAELRCGARPPSASVLYPAGSSMRFPFLNTTFGRPWFCASRVLLTRPTYDPTQALVPAMRSLDPSSSLVYSFSAPWCWSGFALHSEWWKLGAGAGHRWTHWAGTELHAAVLGDSDKLAPPREAWPVCAGRQVRPSFSTLWSETWTSTTKGPLRFWLQDSHCTMVPRWLWTLRWGALSGLWERTLPCSDDKWSSFGQSTRRQREELRGTLGRRALQIGRHRRGDWGPMEQRSCGVWGRWRNDALSFCGLSGLGTHGLFNPSLWELPAESNNFYGHCHWNWTVPQARLTTCEKCTWESHELNSEKVRWTYLTTS